MNRMEMAGINPIMLAACGIETRTMSIRGCSNLRRPLPFEEVRSDIVRCAGGLILTGLSHSVFDSSGEEVARCRVRSNKVQAVDGLRLQKSKMLWRPSDVVAEQLGFSIHTLGHHAGTSIVFLAAETLGTLMLHFFQAACFLPFPCWPPSSSKLLGYTLS